MKINDGWKFFEDCSLNPKKSFVLMTFFSVLKKYKSTSAFVIMWMKKKLEKKLSMTIKNYNFTNKTLSENSMKTQENFLFWKNVKKKLKSAYRCQNELQQFLYKLMNKQLGREKFLW